MTTFLQFLLANPAITAGLAGAAGAIVAQAIAGTIAARAASKRFKKEQQERELDRAAAERERFDETRREVYADVLVRSSSIAQLLADGGPGLDRVERELDELGAKIEVVGLLTPPVYEVCVASYNDLSSWFEEVKDGPLADPVARYQEFRKLRHLPMREMMRGSIKGLNGVESVAVPKGFIARVKEHLTDGEG